MIVSQEALEKILGISQGTPLSAEEMAKKLKITFFPFDPKKLSPNVQSFVKKFEAALIDLGVTIIPYEKALTRVPIKKRIKRTLFALKNTIRQKVLPLTTGNDFTLETLSHIKGGKKIKPGFSVIALGDYDSGNLPIDHTMSFRESNVVTLVDMPPDINRDTEFHKHFDTAMNMFAYHMTNIIIGVSEEEWILYNFNASHPIFPINKDLKENILHSLIPKIASPIRPPKFSDFALSSKVFRASEPSEKPFVEDLLSSGNLLEKAGLYPPGKSVDTLPFRNAFYKWVGKLHIDHRTGMSYGFVARQLPAKLSELIPEEKARRIFFGKITAEKDYFFWQERIFLILHLPQGKFCVEVPDVWVITSRSGADKTHLRPEKDIIKMGISHGKMLLELPPGLTVRDDYKPSFDTKVILAHAIGNAIIGSVLKYLSPDHAFAKMIEDKGIAIAHWHGYMNPRFLPEGWYIHGAENPHVACSSPQSAVYALEGKLGVFLDSLEKGKPYRGDLHIEPHHGSNICYDTLQELGKFFLQGDNVVRLGSHYLNAYKR